MTTQNENYVGLLFDQTEILDSIEQRAVVAHDIANTILQISQIVIDFASIYRIPRFCINRKENDAEHSFMLALAGIEISKKYYPGLDTGFVGQLSLVHDLPELKTGDIPTFDITDESLAHKHLREATELPNLLKELPPHLGDLLSVYEEQQVPEARLVKHIDKLLPYSVDINGAGIAMMIEDCGVTNAQQLLEKNEILESRFRAKFTDITHVPLHEAHTILANKFALQFEEV